MNTAPSQSGLSLETQLAYRNNFARQVLSLTLYIQAEVMNALTLKHGHTQLRLNFEPYITLAGDSGTRLSDIADILGITRQAVNQTANQLEAAGYLLRTPDRSDGRAKLLTRTPRAKAMVAKGALEAERIQSRFSRLVSEAKLAKATQTLTQLNQELGLLLPPEGQSRPVLASALPRLSDYITSRLQALTMAKGHPALKRSFGSVLMSIGPHGGRIQQMANARDVSKQAISSIALELEELDYIERQQDPEDARQITLLFTARGRQLIDDSIRSTTELYQEFAALVGTADLDTATDVVDNIYRSLQLDEDVFGIADNQDIAKIARQLKQQLGEKDVHALARLILSGKP